MTSIAGGSSAYTVTLTNGFTLSSDPLAVNLGAGGSLTIDGGGVIIDGANSFRGLFVYAGNVTIRDLRLSHTRARGGDGGGGWGYARYASTGSTDVLGNAGGGGAGLGGGLFVASGGTVTVSNVSILTSSAFGGNGGGYTVVSAPSYGGFSGGGGGMGGGGGSPYGRAATKSGGGGGIGSTATGGGSGGAGTGIIPGALSGGVGYNGTLNTVGGSWGGGGGYDGGGGGVGGGSVPSAGYATGAGGFGGGGGGGAYYVVHDPSHYRGNGGNGGFGGGGGGGVLVVKAGITVANKPSGNGGFGGGGGGGLGLTGSNGGFGAGAGGVGNSGGGGGLGAGADIFVEQGGRLIVQTGQLGAGTVQGGTGGGAGQAGLAFGSGVFIQGNQTITLAPPTGQALIISGNIADQTGSGGTMGNAGAGSIAIAGTAAGGGGTVTFNGAAANRYTGPTTIGTGATLEIGATTTAGSGDIVLAAGTGTTLRLDGTAALPNSIDGLAGFGTLDLAGLPFVVGGTATVALSTLVVTEGVNSETFDVSGLPAGAVFNVGPDSHSGTAVSLACFAEGTRIATEAGPVAVEHLHAGDRVRSAFGGLAPVVWIGHRRVNCRRHPRPQEVWPVRVQIGAFGDGVPHCDVWLSPDHAVFADAVLVPIRYLVNGASIAQVPVDEVTYWHVELPAHDVLLAEGLPAESYLDTGNRGAFDDGGVAPTHLHPDFARSIWAANACADLVVNGPKLEVAKRSVFAQVRALGYRITSDPDLSIMVDGRHLSAEVRGKTWLVSLSPDVRSVRLVSHDWVPAHVLPDNDDTRSLGVAIANVRLDGRTLSLDDPRFCSGWQAPEPQWRWTDGDAELVLSSVRKLAFDVVMTGRYWERPAELNKAWVDDRRRSRLFETGIPACEVG